MRCGAEQTTQLSVGLPENKVIFFIDGLSILVTDWMHLSVKAQSESETWA